MTKLTPAKREEVVRLKEEHKWEWRDIEIAVKVPWETCRKYYQTYKRNKTLPPKVVNRKTGKITARIGIRLKQYLRENPKYSFRKLEGLINEEFQVQVSFKTIQRYMTVQGFETVEAHHRPLLSPLNQRRRLAFALKFYENIDKLRRIMWSDEVSVSALPDKRKVYIKVHKSVSDMNRPFVPQKQRGGFSVMFWGAFSFFAFGPLIVVDGQINKHTYLQFAKDFIVPELNASPHDLIFMQDNARPHTAKIVKDYFAEKNVELVDWPAQSPDLNPIENIWAIIKQQLYSQEKFASTPADLINRVLNIWSELQQDLLERLSNSVVHRLHGVIDRKGGWLKK